VNIQSYKLLLVYCWFFFLTPGDKHHEDGYEGGSREGGFVSSLFNHNPEIPKLNLTNAEPQKEDVFSAKTFAETGVHPYISKALSDVSMETLTLVQSKAIPVILGGKDALIKSQTGSGKTLAYAVPILHKLQEERPGVSVVKLTFSSSLTLRQSKLARFVQGKFKFVNIAKSPICGDVVGYTIRCHNTRDVDTSSLCWMSFYECCGILHSGTG